MINKTLPILTAVIGSLFLVACVNLKPVPSQTASYTLGPVDVELPVQGSTENQLIYIIRPQVPTYSDGSHLSYRLSSGEVRNITGTRWAEPLAEGIARAMSLYLSRSSAVAIEGYYPWPNTSKSAARLTLNFQRFGATESGKVQVVANWILRDSNDDLKNGLFVSNSLDWEVENPDSLVAAYNGALLALAQEIESSLSN